MEQHYKSSDSIIIKNVSPTAFHKHLIKVKFYSESYIVSFIVEIKCFS